jgi:hypothetical protein
VAAEGSKSGRIQSDLNDTSKFLVLFKECASKEFYSNGKFNVFIVYNIMWRRVAWGEIKGLGAPNTHEETEIWNI